MKKKKSLTVAIKIGRLKMYNDNVGFEVRLSVFEGCGFGIEHSNVNTFGDECNNAKTFQP